MLLRFPYPADINLQEVRRQLLDIGCEEALDITDEGLLDYIEELGIADDLLVPTPGQPTAAMPQEEEPLVPQLETVATSVSVSESLLFDQEESYEIRQQPITAAPEPTQNFEVDPDMGNDLDSCDESSIAAAQQDIEDMEARMLSGHTTSDTESVATTTARLVIDAHAEASPSPLPARTIAVSNSRSNVESVPSGPEPLSPTFRDFNGRALDFVSPPASKRTDRTTTAAATAATGPSRMVEEVANTSSTRSPVPSRSNRMTSYLLRRSAEKMGRPQRILQDYSDDEEQPDHDYDSVQESAQSATDNSVESEIVGDVLVTDESASDAGLTEAQTTPLPHPHLLGRTSHVVLPTASTVTPEDRGAKRAGQQQHRQQHVRGGGHSPAMHNKVANANRREWENIVGDRQAKNSQFPVPLADEEFEIGSRSGDENDMDSESAYSGYSHRALYHASPPSKNRSFLCARSSVLTEERKKKRTYIVQVCYSQIFCFFCMPDACCALSAWVIDLHFLKRRLAAKPPQYFQEDRSSRAIPSNEQGVEEGQVLEGECKEGKAVNSCCCVGVFFFSCFETCNDGQCTQITQFQHSQGEFFFSRLRWRLFTPK